MPSIADIWMHSLNLLLEHRAFIGRNTKGAHGKVYKVNTSEITSIIIIIIIQGTKLTFLARSRLAPKFSKVVAKAKKLGAIKKKR